jgi:hypothetical protein
MEEREASSSGRMPGCYVAVASEKTNDPCERATRTECYPASRMPAHITRSILPRFGAARCRISSQLLSEVASPLATMRCPAVRQRLGARDGSPSRDRSPAPRPNHGPCAKIIFKTRPILAACRADHHATLRTTGECLVRSTNNSARILRHPPRVNPSFCFCNVSFRDEHRG